MKEYGERYRYGWSSMKERRREFRKNPTKSENALWQLIRAKRLHGLQFRRQHGIGRFVVDFCHTKSRTIIELDGGVHDRPEVQEYDRAREEELKGMGYQIIRFQNEEVLNDMNKVLEKILDIIQIPDTERSGQPGRRKNQRTTGFKNTKARKKDRYLETPISRRTTERSLERKNINHKSKT